MYIPRLNDNGINGNFHWYSENPFYQSGYGMPNCTCYAWGRFWEIGDPLSLHINRPDLPLGDGGTWWSRAIAAGVYQTGQSPQLGAVICFDRPGASGHVAIVEAIGTENGRNFIVTSNSAWQSTYFYTQTLYSDQGYSWGSYVFQGFIYNPYADQPEPPPTPTTEKKHKFPWAIYSRNFRNGNLKRQ